MNNYVIDVNVLFGAFISGKEIYPKLFIKNKVFLPDFALLEINKYKEIILKKNKLKPEILREFVINLLSNITVIPEFLISSESIKTAYELCKDIDEKDSIYIALSIEFNIPLVTNDKKLTNGLRNKGFKNIIPLEEFMSQN